MTLKRVSDEEIWEILGSPDDWKAQTIGFILGGKPLEKPKPIALDGKYGLVAQAQLEACEKEHKAVIRRLIAEVKYITNREELDEHLKQKHEVSNEWGYVL